MAAKTSIERSAERCHLAITTCPDTRELYGYAQPVLDERATMRRVALLHRGSGRAHLSQPEREAALEVLHERFSDYLESTSSAGVGL